MRSYYDSFVKQKADWESYQHADPEFMMTSFKLEEFSLNALCQAYNRLLWRHESLRTVFHKNIDQLWQVVLAGRPEEGFYIKTIKDAGHAISIEAVRNKLLKLHKGLSISPLFEVIVHSETSSSVAHIFVGVHHIICDSWSMNILKDELQRAYHSFVIGQPELPIQPTFQLKDYAIERNAELIKNQIRFSAYWHNKLNKKLIDFLIDRNYCLLLKGDCAENQLTIKAKTDAILNELEKQNISAICSYKIPVAKTRKLRAFAFTEHFSHSIIFSTLISVAMAQIEQLDEVLISTVIADRYKPKYNNIIGHLIGAVYLKIALDENDTLADTVRNSKEELIRSMRYMIFEYNTTKDIQLTACSMIHLNYVVDKTNPLKVDVEPVHQRCKKVFHPLTFSIQDTENEFLVFIYYNERFYSKMHVNALVERINTLIEMLPSSTKIELKKNFQSPLSNTQL